MLYSIQYSYQKEYIPNRNLRYFPTENGRKFVGKHLIKKKKKVPLEHVRSILGTQRLEQNQKNVMLLSYITHTICKI